MFKCFLIQITTACHKIRPVVLVFPTIFSHHCLLIILSFHTSPPPWFCVFSSSFHCHHLSNTFSSSYFLVISHVFSYSSLFLYLFLIFPSSLLLPPHFPKLPFMIHCCDTASLLSQVARTITNMQQQIQQHQRQLYQALLMKQQQLPSHSSSSSSSSGLHPPGPGSGKSTLDPFTGPHQAPGLTDTLHTKEPPSSPNAYSTYPLCESMSNSFVN